MSEMNVNELLAQMRAMADAARGTQLNPGTQGNAPDFANMLKQSIDQVNENQMAAGALKQAFEVGDPNVDIAQVMVAVQKAGVSFQAMVQVRNRLISAYQDIMNMPV
jgi:flagellar hook-basal body complex protein FliE